MNLQLHLNGVYLTSQTHKFRFLNSPKVKAYTAFLQKNQDVLIDQPCLTGEPKKFKIFEKKNLLIDMISICQFKSASEISVLSFKWTDKNGLKKMYGVDLDIFWYYFWTSLIFDQNQVSIIPGDHSESDLLNLNEWTLVIIE